jgi:hypothetical protein
MLRAPAQEIAKLELEHVQDFQDECSSFQVVPSGRDETRAWS